MISAMTLASAQAWATPAPARPMEPIQPGWSEITLKVDLRNLVGPDDFGKIAESEMNARLDSVNNVWSQCQIHFKSRLTANVSTETLGIPYAPRSQEELSKIAAALNPQGFTAIPVTIAGPWSIQEGTQGFRLTGLGWVFGNSEHIDRIGAMISATKFHDPAAGPIIAHELAHALSLPHISEKDNLMGVGGTNLLSREQCQQARKFAEITLQDFITH